ncbi:MAG TPA: hypothetical protein VKT32_12065 [Chthonomonadaceae bacterium]|nr:hypothetical protein [Chthonomonadaceae bacterium]
MGPILAKTWPYLAALILAVLIVFVDGHVDNTTIPATLLLIFGLMLGFVAPKGALGVAPILGLAIFAAHTLGPSLGYKPPYQPSPTVAATLLALIPAFLGTYAGVGLNRLCFSS